MIHFDNSHLNLPALRRQKITPATKVTFGPYKGKKMYEILREDYDYATYLGDTVNSNWTWHMLLLWRQASPAKHKPKSKTKANNYKPLVLEDKMPFGKFKGKTIKYLGTYQKSYLLWVKNNTDCKFGQDVISKFFK